MSNKKESDKEQRLTKQIAYNNCNLLRDILEENRDVAKKFDFPLVYFLFLFFTNILGKQQQSNAIN